jgi:hypothetical protein
MKTSPALLLLALLVPCMAWATEFHVSGADISGRMVVNNGKAAFQLLEGAQPLRIEARIRRTPTGFRLRYEVTETSRRFKPGMRHWVTPDPSLDPWRPITSVVETVFTREAKGVYAGTIKGRKLRLNSVPDTKGWTVLVVPGASRKWRGEETILRALRARGLSARGVNVLEPSALAKNAEIIAREVRAEAAKGKQVILVGVGPGGAEIRAAFASEPGLGRSALGAITIRKGVSAADKTPTLEIEPKQGRLIAQGQRLPPRVSLRETRTSPTDFTNAAFDTLLSLLRPTTPTRTPGAR